MLGKKHAPPVAQSASTSKPVDTIDTLIGQKSLLKGDLEFVGGLRVDGQVKGSVSALDDSSGTLVLSEMGKIEGNVTVPHVIVNGAINGNISSTGRVELQAKARINGDVHYNTLEMALGASINGKLVCETEEAAAANLKSVAPEVSTEKIA
jgi:cytoskeletal protein CcmA (bactofilin family)